MRNCLCIKCGTVGKFFSGSVGESDAAKLEYAVKQVHSPGFFDEASPLDEGILTACIEFMCGPRDSVALIRRCIGHLGSNPK